MTEKEKSAVDEYMARPDLPETLKATNREFIGSPDDWALAIEANAAKAAPLASELAKWQALAQSPWEAPGGLLDAMAALERDYPVTLPLALAVDLMAFGSEAVPAGDSMGAQLEAGARRRRARQALLDAAGQAKFPIEHGPDSMPIKPGRFKFIQGPGLDGDSLEFNDLKEGEPDKRLQVVQIVEAGKFYGWVCERFGVSSSNDPSLAASGREMVTPPRAARRRPKTPARRQKYAWSEGKLYFNQLLAERGDLDSGWPEWSTQADIEREIMAHMRDYGGGEPPLSSVQANVRQWLIEFRSAR